MLAHVLDPLINWAHCLIVAAFEGYGYAIVFYLNVPSINMMKLKVDIGSVFNVIPVEGRSYLLHNIGHVGIVRGVKTILEWLLISSSDFDNFRHRFLELFAHPEFSCGFVEALEEERVEIFVNVFILLLSPVQSLRNAFESFSEDHIAVEGVDNEALVFKVSNSFVDGLSEVLVVQWCHFLLKVFKVLIGLFVIASLSSDFGDNWTGFWVQIIVPLWLGI